MNSSINFGLLPAAVMRVGVEMSFGMDSSFQSRHHHVHHEKAPAENLAKPGIEALSATNLCVLEVPGSRGQM
jgi:hypothetical protein